MALYYNTYLPGIICRCVLRTFSSPLWDIKGGSRLKKTLRTWASVTYTHQSARVAGVFITGVGKFGEFFFVLALGLFARVAAVFLSGRKVRSRALLFGDNESAME